MIQVDPEMRQEVAATCPTRMTTPPMAHGRPAIASPPPPRRGAGHPKGPATASPVRASPTC